MTSTPPSSPPAISCPGPARRTTLCSLPDCFRFSLPASCAQVPIPTRKRESDARQNDAVRRCATSPPEWLIQYGAQPHERRRSAHGECWATAESGRCRPATRQQVMDALRQQVPACVHCRPDTALGILDQLWPTRPAAG
ncbi:DUF6233 domain-containing protein [Streptomyces cynarae]|uniref:DUF6233 domain-containing protein n=1 Tax=Streptomyces cynarae TaxID=2981134 RepID=UPI00406C39A5